MSHLTDEGTRALPGCREDGGANQIILDCENRRRSEKISLFARGLLLVILKLSIGFCVLCFAYLLSLESDLKPPARHRARPVADFLSWQMPRASRADEQRVARHFEMDTLPGLMQRGLIRRYERREMGTLLLVEGKIWRQRSRFFRESLLTEMLVYNKVNGFAPETQVVDYASRRLYARASASDRKEFFD
jgi:hypothetical protein